MRLLLSSPAVWLGWVLSRLVLARLLIGSPMPFGDVHYYHVGLWGTDPTAMLEYPDAGVWPVRLLGWITTPDITAFLAGFVVMCVLIDAAFLALVLRFGGQRRFVAGWFWVFFGVATGHVLWLRLDLFPGILVAAAAALLLRHPALASAVLAGAAAVKLWPAVLAAGLVGGMRRVGTWLRVGSFFAALAVLAGITGLTSGLDRLLSPLSYQGDRGIQIESLAATPFLIAAHENPGGYWMGFAESRSFEIAGPGTATAVQVADFAMIAVLVAAFGWALWQLFADRWHPLPAVAFMLTMVLLLIVSNKVFSPQYIVWIGPLLAVCLTLTRSRLVSAMAILTVFAAALGLYVFPYNYDPLWQDPVNATTVIAALALRNALIVVLTGLSVAWLLQETRRTSHPRSRRASSSTSSPLTP
ncbi:MAG: DUF2029 domain-containing protein [Corynebacterium sp.]|uniref:DUF2029 domain-containing protein n=1 Tax=Corynebacterium sp. TaxID=1720 RepID=UPI0026DEA4F5|nr:DUF2029 domain-containing protein [Corynebacterium sp.]MDO5670628.1 DUF2029 domain-containing protein [Corynebacterium sp.]